MVKKAEAIMVSQHVRASHSTPDEKKKGKVCVIGGERAGRLSQG